MARKKKEEKKGVVEFPFNSKIFLKQWEQWKDYKKKEHKFNYKTVQSEQAALLSLSKLATNEFEAIEIIHESIANGWKGFFELKNKKNGRQNTTLQNQLRNYKSQLDN